MLRIISQDGTVDIPYDCMVIQVDGLRIFAIYPGTDGNSGIWKLAEYKSPEKVKKAVLRLKQRAQKLMILMIQKDLAGLLHYDAVPSVFRFPREDELEG